MAYSERKKNSMIPWQPMLKKWTWYTGQNAPSKVEVVKKYFNTFVSKHHDYEFIIAQTFSGLYDIGISWIQYDEIKEELESMIVPLVALDLPDVQDNEFLAGGSIKTRSFRSQGEFRKWQENKRAEKNRPIVAKKYKEVKKHYKKVTKIFREPEENDIMSFDLEVYEHDNEIMLEIGFIVVRFSPSARRRNLPDIEVIRKRHFIIKENLRYSNEDFVPDNREGYVFGSSRIVSMKEAVKKFKKYMNKSDFLLGHSVQNDDKYLKNNGVDLTSKRMWDTQLIELHEEMKPDDERFFMRSLSTLLKRYGVRYKNKDLHNAGCDACYTMLVFLRQMGYNEEIVNGLLERF